jgi:hypothetical protein
MIFKLLVAGMVGAGLLYGINTLMTPAPTCSSCPSQTMAWLGTGFAVGAGVQLSVMLLGVS